jgi:hypothetical protein
MSNQKLLVEKVSKEDYHQWLSNPVTKAMTAQLTNEVDEPQQLNEPTQPIDIGEGALPIGQGVRA